MPARIYSSVCSAACAAAAVLPAGIPALTSGNLSKKLPGIPMWSGKRNYGCAPPVTTARSAARGILIS